MPILGTEVLISPEGSNEYLLAQMGRRSRAAVQEGQACGLRPRIKRPVVPSRTPPAKECGPHLESTVVLCSPFALILHLK